MTPSDFAALVTDTEAQLDAARRAAGAGEGVDLSDLLPRIEALCALALAERRPSSAGRLARILAGLDLLQAALRARIAALATEARPDPKRAAETYRAASVSKTAADERK